MMANLNSLMTGVGRWLPKLDFDNLSLLIAITAIVGVALLILLKKDKAAWHKIAPSLITSLGILCTFIGVSLGLVRFNPDNTESLSFLFAGLKLAFIPSAVAILIAIGFKWLHTKQHTQNTGALFLDKLEQNTTAVEKLVTAIQAVDWQVAYKQNLEVNIEHNSQLLAVLENSLNNLLQTLNAKGTEVVTASCDLKQSIQETSRLLQQVNSDLTTTAHSLANVDQQRQATRSELEELHQEYDNFRQIMQQLQTTSSTVAEDLKLAVNSHVRSLEKMINTELKRTLNQVGTQSLAS